MGSRYCRTHPPEDVDLTKSATYMAIVMAFDAFGLCLGMKPKHFTVKQVLAWIEKAQGRRKGRK